MKIFALITLSFLTGAVTAFSQENNNEKPERLKLYPSSHTNNSNSPEAEIEACEQHLEALDAKEAWIRSNPEELKKARENGWFSEAEKTRKELLQRIKELKK